MKPRIMEVTNSPKVTRRSELGFEFILSGSVDCQGFPGSSADEESACNAGDLGSISGFGKIPWRKGQLPALVSWPGEFHGLYSPWGHKELIAKLFSINSCVFVLLYKVVVPNSLWSSMILA